MTSSTRVGTGGGGFLEVSAVAAAVDKGATEEGSRSKGSQEIKADQAPREKVVKLKGRDIRFDENVFPARDAPTGQPKPRATSTAGDWTFVDAAHGSRTVPRLSLPPVVHENRFAALETDASDDATIEMSDDGFDTPSDMSMAQFSLSPPASDVTDDSADPIDFLSCPSRAAAFAATTADSPVVELEGPTEDPQCQANSDTLTATLEGSP
ncbi:BZ3500_MvSof-1268-A1-R1_Chr6-2g08567 [Microbotryum saponariae]|uniref:BZ3500_MvSof-1268-A1-R1_Chr6-2g08567 protein n=1 Tax=Microbotryum saponariae TaxID=289078 RepID=A0A2X0L3F7_9BASI|nr:BZ3500_MvSof-1268-A1-R1_Chr6-2g08567 [Microbotryum saponariae]SDA07843.1 BZ3501_MvSof-1269-A2-R1_Chr6-1g08280 [Microbotryum saponariae]